MKYPGDITPEAYAAMEEGYEQGVAAKQVEIEGIRFRVEVACDGYSMLMDTDVPAGVISPEDYQQGAHDAAEAIRAALRGGRGETDSPDRAERGR